jgi:hypothetical protein
MEKAALGRPFSLGLPGMPLAELASTGVFLNWRFFVQRIQAWRNKQEGKLGYILLWALGVPIPVLFVIFLLRGCT